MAWPPTNDVVLYDLFSDAVKQGDTSKLLERFCQGLQTDFDIWVRRLVELPYLLDAFRIPALQGSDGRTTLDYALWRVGFTDEMEGFTAQLSEAQKRLLLHSAAALWKRKGLPQGWLRWIRLLTGRCAWYADYFYWRHILDEDAIGETVLLDPIDESVPGSEVYGAFESDLYVEDPQDSAMRTLIASLVDLSRPLSERIRVRWPDVLEIWDRSAVLSRWARSGSYVLDTAAREVALAYSGTTPASMHYTRMGTAFAWYTAQAVFRADDATAILDFDVHWLDGTHRITVRLKFSAGTIEVLRCNGGAEIVVAMASPADFPAVATGYLLQVELSPRMGPGFAFEVRIDGESMLSGFTTGAVPAGGYLGWTVRQGSMAAGRLMAWVPPLTYDWLAPSGAFDEEA